MIIKKKVKKVCLCVLFHNSAAFQDFTALYYCKAIVCKEHIILVYFRKTLWFTIFIFKSITENFTVSFLRYFQKCTSKILTTSSQRLNFVFLFNCFLGNKSLGWIFLAKYCRVNTFDLLFIYLKILTCFPKYTSMVHTA